jgi:acyl-CoA reductase-like NAD-dependent aldehyde dehydrogenase
VLVVMRAPVGDSRRLVFQRREQHLAGSVGINGDLPDPAGPIGGYKASGIGREYGPEALVRYRQIKSIYC